MLPSRAVNIYIICHVTVNVNVVLKIKITIKKIVFIYGIHAKQPILEVLY